MSVALVVVSHSKAIAEGTCELAAQMATDVVLLPAGGTDDGRIGTSFETVMSTIEQALATNDVDGVVVMTDLGSSVMVAESVLDFLDEPARERVRLAHAPIVEGTVAASAAARLSKSLDEVAAAAEAAGGGNGALDRATPGSSGERSISVDLTLVNETGLHARPAAKLAEVLDHSGAETTVNGVNGSSAMMLMTLGARRGSTITVTASGPNAQQAIDDARSLVEGGFGES